MFPTAFTHSITQFARTLSLPERVQHSPLRNLTLEGFRQRNTTLDSLFYDVKSISAEEAFYISSCLAAEGAILIVHPSGGQPLTLCDTIDDFVFGGGVGVDTLAVAGVGSSALGSAALARNIADALGKPVAVVVSGYGLADVVTEALGGHFLFGYLNGFRHTFERLDEFFGRPQFGVAPKLSAEKLLEASLDMQTVKALLTDPRLSFNLVVGHSKGNLVISEALYAIAHSDLSTAEALARTMRIITLSARIAMPRPFRNIVDVMGEWDWFGEINSRHSIESDEIVPQAGHHTNTELPNHLPVTEVIRKIVGLSPAEPRPQIDATILPLPFRIAAAAPALETSLAEPEAVAETMPALPVREETPAEEPAVEAQAVAAPEEPAPEIATPTLPAENTESAAAEATAETEAMTTRPTAAELEAGSQTIEAVSAPEEAPIADAKPIAADPVELEAVAAVEPVAEPEPDSPPPAPAPARATGRPTGRAAPRKTGRGRKG